MRIDGVSNRNCGGGGGGGGGALTSIYMVSAWFLFIQNFQLVVAIQFIYTVV